MKPGQQCAQGVKPSFSPAVAIKEDMFLPYRGITIILQSQGGFATYIYHIFGRFPSSLSNASLLGKYGLAQRRAAEVSSPYSGKVSLWVDLRCSSIYKTMGLMLLGTQTSVASKHVS